MNNRQLVRECNELARKFYRMQGYQQPESFKFYDATHPHERSMWRMAVESYDHIEGTEVNDALEELRDDETLQQP